MAKMTVYHGGYVPVENPEIVLEGIRRISERILLYGHKKEQAQ